MKRIFTFAIALMSLLVTAKAANVTFSVTVPAGTNSCWIVGSFNSWNNNDKKLTKVDATHYTITMDDATWAAGVTTANVQYKYCSGGGDWAYVEKYADGSEIHANRVYTGTNTWTDPNKVLPDETQIGTNGVDVVARWATVWADIPPLPLNVTIDVLVPKGTFQCYVVGTFNSWAGPTAPADSCKMKLIATNPDGTMVFEKTVFTADANKLAFHFCCGPDWAFEQLAPTGDFHYPGDVSSAVVTSWKKIFDPSTLGNVTVTATVPAGTGPNVWIQGGWLGWNFASGGGGQLMTKNVDGTFSYTINNVAGTEYKLYNRQDWGFVEADALGVEVANRVLPVTPGQTTSVAITVVGWKQAYNTGIQELNMDNYKIYTNNNKIVVEGVVSSVELFNLDGRRIQTERLSGTFTSKTLNNGLYVIRVDGATKKVSVN